MSKLSKLRSSDDLGTKNVGSLLFRLGLPAAIAFLSTSLYNIIDVIFVGRWVGHLGIAALTVTGPISFLIASLGIVTGVGGSAMISKALGLKDKRQASRVFGNQITITLGLSVLMVFIGWEFENEMLYLFGAKGDIIIEADLYYNILLLSVPFLAFNSMVKSVISAEAKAKVVMVYSIIGNVINVVLDIVFIHYLDMGIQGAAWATAVAFMVESCLFLFFMVKGQTELSFGWEDLKLKLTIVKEVFMIGSSSLANELIMSLLVIVLNHTLFEHKEEIGVALYGIVSRLYMLFFVPVMAAESGFRPIAAYNLGANNKERIRKALIVGIKWTSAICVGMMAVMVITAEDFIHIFTHDEDLVLHTEEALDIIISFAPTLALQMIAIAFFQIMGKSNLATIVLVFKYVILLIPSLLILPQFLDWHGVLFTFPITDICATILAFWLLRKEMKRVFSS